MHETCGPRQVERTLEISHHLHVLGSWYMHVNSSVICSDQPGPAEVLHAVPLRHGGATPEIEIGETVFSYLQVHSI